MGHGVLLGIMWSLAYGTSLYAQIFAKHSKMKAAVKIASRATIQRGGAPWYETSVRGFCIASTMPFITINERMIGSNGGDSTT